VRNAGRSILTLGQEYGECMADMPAGMKINFDEQNMTKWEVLMDGPDQSVYAVCIFGSRAQL
jgi:ubiquitin-protein ligase